MVSSISLNLFWVLSAFFLSLVSLLIFKGDPHQENSLLYIIFHLAYFALTYLANKKKMISKKPLKVSSFLLGVFIILFTEPLFENDHYRYIWEGRILIQGKNPYVLPPSSLELNEIDYDAKEDIAFKNLTTIYPPVSLLWFGVAGHFSASYRFGLILLMLLNSLLVFFLLSKVWPLIRSKWLLILCLPLIQKEYIQSVHIDLFAFMWVFYFLFDEKSRYFRHFVYILLSIFSKIIGVFFVFIYFLRYFKEKKRLLSFWVFIILLIFSFPIFYQYLHSIGGVGGYNAFSQTWVWNPGFYSFLSRFLNYSDEASRKMIGVLFCIYILILGSFSLVDYKKKLFEVSMRRKWEITYLFFSGLMFFSPVYNAWYVIWFLIPALMLNLKTGVFYGIFSFTCYFSYLNKDLLPLGEFLGHIFFLISLWELYRSRMKFVA